MESGKVEVPFYFAQLRLVIASHVPQTLQGKLQLLLEIEFELHMLLGK